MPILSTVWLLHFLSTLYKEASFLYQIGIKAFFKKKKYITINNPQKSRKNYDLTYDNVAIPEVHTHEASDSTNAVSSNASVDYDNLAIPEVHIKGRK